ncbi:glycoside hydrolase family 76 protein [Zasmidium cellare ATCC 36951]|uniref:Mannan endo-1,6-alpha-mannosidase n=1 Tax=Zasmidium cellare ATCC 36951 TaxID=1080233 RepID=A0A6A6CHK1_ZASCE|nr:glycoside hydrolase family 76 protein [Zasmidium cellare ATCC 36951]KAF2166123.1 glycoside hydrolase family 76 protein [Zasmidium cellare ATCC 36951]
MRSTTFFASILFVARWALAIDLNLDDPESIKRAARTAADGMMQWYDGNKTGGIPGLLPGPFYWWEAGAMFGSLIDYWYYTGDTSYNDVVTEALLFQVGADVDYMPANQSKSLGNDDQAFWGLSALTAAETNFPNPPAGQPQWLALAQAVFNTQKVRWDETSCAGGLKWQIFTFNNGYNYKNSISNGCFMNMAARLAMYTGNTSYNEWADRAWEWSRSVGLVSDTYLVYDGTDDNLDCKELNHLQWSYNSGVYLMAAATMWNITEGATRDQWQTRTQGLLNATKQIFFYPNGTMQETACEGSHNCNIDQQTFKAYLSRWMAASTKVAPWTKDTIMPLLASSAEAAAKSCTGGDDGVTCGTSWTGGWDGAFGVGQQMNALEVFQSNLISTARGPVGNSTGGTSQGDPNAGSDSGSTPITYASSHQQSPPSANLEVVLTFERYNAITTGDRAGAGILTAIVLIGLVGGGYWIVT